MKGVKAPIESPWLIEIIVIEKAKKWCLDLTSPKLDGAWQPSLLQMKEANVGPSLELIEQRLVVTNAVQNNEGFRFNPLLAVDSLDCAEER